MSVKRLAGIPGFSIDRVAAAAGNDPEILRLENLDTDLAPPRAAIEATHAALETDEANSYLPFTGRADLCAAVARHVSRFSGVPYAPEQALITCGGTEATFDALLALTDPGDEVIVTDPTYAGIIQRVRLAGAVPRFVPWVAGDAGWRLDVGALRAAVGEKTRAVVAMSPSMPCGGVLNAEEWAAVAAVCRERSLWLVYIAAMERILFDGLPLLHPAALDRMAERTVIIGSVSKEFRMIGWRIGWVVAPPGILTDIARVHIYNVVTPTGIAQAGARAALESPEQDFEACRAEWERRHNAVMDQLKAYPVVRASGGWSLLMDVGKLGLTAGEASKRLLERGKIAATPMTHWGDRNADQYVRLVFSNEPVHRLAELGRRAARALG
jgi:aspartate/methionine/tyrosine aminotransferase